MVKGCDVCFFKLPCRCSISTNTHFFAPRFVSCHHDADNMTTIHPVNLALLQHFFDDSFVDNNFADTIFSKAVNVSLPTLKLYEHKMSTILAADTKAHLSLSKMASTAKTDAIIFQNLAEPLLDGQITLNPNWPSTDNILLYIASSATIILTVVLTWTIFKLRKLTTALLVVERVQNARAVVTDIPSFIYNAKSSKQNEISSTIDFSIDLTWEQANFILICSLFTIIVVYLWKCYQQKHKPKLFLEITCGTECSLIDIIQLPMCPSTIMLMYLCQFLTLKLLRARRNENEMKVKPATSFKLLTIFIHKK